MPTAAEPCGNNLKGSPAQRDDNKGFVSDWWCARWHAQFKFSKSNADQSEICALDKTTERLTLASEDVTSLPGIGI